MASEAGLYLGQHFVTTEYNRPPQLRIFSAWLFSKNVSEDDIPYISVLTRPSAASAFRARVSFDTFDNRDASDFSLTLNRKHNQYAYTKRSRTFLCGTDANDYSDTALEWLIDELVDDGDEVVCLRVVEKESKEARDWAGPNQTREGREKGYRAEAQRMLERIQAKNTEDRAINLVLEFSIGKVQDTIQHMVSHPAAILKQR